MYIIILRNARQNGSMKQNVSASLFINKVADTHDRKVVVCRALANPIDSYVIRCGICQVQTVKQKISPFGYGIESCNI